MLNRVKGTQDFIDVVLFNFIIERIKKHLSVYNFTEIMTPILEPTELFVRSLGTHTDVINKEMFIIKSKDEDQADSICLRPEATASTVRAFVENGIQATPWKVFTYGPMFRYERPQKGRFRQFHQCSMEVIGSSSVAQDAQFIKMLDRFFHEILAINNYALLINYLGCHSDRQEYKKKLHAFLEKTPGICANCMERKEKNILRIFDCKVETCQQLYVKAPSLLESLCAECKIEWQALQDELEMLSISYVIKPTLVRGLDYYNKTVFEFVSNNLGAQNAFCGGGRYDQLVSQVGGKEDQPSIGAAIGLERVMLMLEAIKDQIALPAKSPLYVILPLAMAQQPLALMLADELQAQGLCTDIFLEGDSVKSMMRKANKSGAAYALLLGEDEQQKNQVTVKNMITGAEEKIAQSAVVEYLRK